MFPLFLILPSVIYSVVLLRGFWSLKREGRGERALNSVTVIVPVRNEAGRIGACLEGLAQQDFPADRLQIIVVDDHSDDGTPEIVRQHLGRFPDAQLVELESSAVGGVSPKKAALLSGLKTARHPVISLLDGDCVPSAGWLRALIGALDTEVTFSSGPVLFDSRGLWAQLLELEFLGLQTAGWLALRYGRPLTASGANLAFRLDECVEPSTLKPDVASGDDVFLVQALARRGAARPVVRKEAVVWTEAPLSVGQFVQQRLRWASKLPRYGVSEVAVLAGVYMFNVFLWFVLAEVLLGTWSGWTFAATIGLKLAADVPIMTWVTRRLDLGRRLLWLPLAEVLESAEILLAPIAFALPFRWKGRQYGRGGRVQGLA